MKQFRKNRRPGNRPMTGEESARVEAAKEGPCMACIVWAMNGGMSLIDVIYGCDYNHAKSGNIRRGHACGYALCAWHHRQQPWGYFSVSATRAHFGPSLMDGSRLFHDTYGSDDFLIEKQTAELGGEYS